ncbi:twin-arginine translocase subunit TatC [candidate division KSB1 bacterium]|nr:twin-arginine translocase subunit TatC [candidate division KSB1 bacterium]
MKKKEKKTDKEKEARMPFLDHLEELRWTIIRSLVSIAVAAVGCYFIAREIIDILIKPAPSDLTLIFLSPTEAFITYLKVAGYGGLVVALPYVSFQIWKFILPGLYAKERKLVLPVAFFTVFCFVLGALFAYFVIIPFGLRFLLSFQTDYLIANITIGKYLGFVVTLLLVFGLVFELPVLSYFFSIIGLLTPDFLRRKRRYGIVIIFLMAALMTPPDAFTQTMLAVPLVLLYEVSIWVSAAVQKKRYPVKTDKQDDLAG